MTQDTHRERIKFSIYKNISLSIYVRNFLKWLNRVRVQMVLFCVRVYTVTAEKE